MAAVVTPFPSKYAVRSVPCYSKCSGKSLREISSTSELFLWP
jgi:hypothetical protein